MERPAVRIAAIPTSLGQDSRIWHVLIFCAFPGLPGQAGFQGDLALLTAATDDLTGILVHSWCFLVVGVTAWRLLD